jgi:hypothetical protein
VFAGPCAWRCCIILGALLLRLLVALLLSLESVLLLEFLVALLLGLESALLLSGKSRDSLRLDARGERLAGDGLSV